MNDEVKKVFLSETFDIFQKYKEIKQLSCEG